MKKLIIPINGTKKDIESQHCFVIVGANGSGKSHLGAWIEMQSRMENVLRISAQRALTIPDNITVKSEAAARNNVYCGHETEIAQGKNYKWNWGKDYTTKLVNDYESVLAALFAKLNKEDRQYVKNCQLKENQGAPKPNVPQMITDKVMDIWNTVFSHREIILEDASIKAKVSGGSDYHGKKMSDGERVAIYLISQCLVAPDGVTIVVDEPEIHLHKSIMHKLWDKIEEYCQNKTFVYITHDLNFASSRKDAKKIWVKSYSTNETTESWDIEELEMTDEIPDSLMIEVLGNRKNVLFVEGEKGSYDNQLYSYIYDNFYVIPAHNCAKVIEMTKAFNNDKVKQLHNVAVKGLIDRDYMTDGEITSYQSQGIYTLDVAEVENLYLSEKIMNIVASHLVLDNPNEVISTVKHNLFQWFQQEFDVHLTSICEREIKHKLNCFNKDQNTKESLKTQLTAIITSVDIDQIYDTTKERLSHIIEQTNYEELIKVYNRKDLIRRVSSYFGLTGYGYADLVLRLLKSDKKASIIEALKEFTPNIN